MQVHTREDFLRVVADNELFSEEDLVAARQATKGLSDIAMIARLLVNQGLLTRWAAGQIVAGKKPLKIGKYRLLDLVDSTPWGPVYLAEHVQLQRKTVIKTLPRQKFVEKSVATQFVQQVRRLSILDHPHLSHLYEVDEEESFYYLAMEHCEGLDLARKVNQQGPLAAWQAADFIRQAANGLAYAHEKDIFHHAITPGLLVANERGNLKLLDTGMAQLEGSEKESVISIKSAMEAADYMAPEQVLQRDAIDQRADIYSLGCSLFFLLTGTPPFKNGEASAEIHSRMECIPPDVRQLRGDVPQELAAICAKMMAGQPENRYQTAAQVASELDAWLASGVASAKPATAVPEKASAAIATAPKAISWTPAKTQGTTRTMPATRARNRRKRKNQRLPAAWHVIGWALAALGLCFLAFFVLGRSKPDDDPRVANVLSQVLDPDEDTIADAPDPGAPADHAAATPVKPPGSENKKDDTPQIANRPLRIEVTVESEKPSGVAIAQGGDQHGYALHFIDGKPAFDVRVKGKVQRLVSHEEASGTVTLTATLSASRMTLAVNGGTPISRPSPGLIPVQPIDRLTVGFDGQTSAGKYQAPHHLHGKVIRHEVTAGEDKRER